MSFLESLSSFEKRIRPSIISNFPKSSVRFYSYGKRQFLKQFFNEIPNKVKLDPNLRVKLWDLEFNCPLFNSAGMFKNGFGYDVVAKQGAGAYLAGTATWLSRNGNLKKGIVHPFVPFPSSGSASNWMGLPNFGSEEIAKNLSEIEKVKYCPLGISLSASPGVESKEALETLINGLKLFELADVDFIEINESCPNTEDSEKDKDKMMELFNRVEYISTNFIKKLNRRLPVILKFSVQTEPNQDEMLLDLAISNNFDGINFGNTVTNYSEIRKFINPNEQTAFDYFTTTFGGGISGRALKENSLLHSKISNEILSKKNLKKEFHIIRTGGIETLEDLNQSKTAGTQLNQWYTGYFEMFSKYGHSLYSELFKENKEKK